MHTSVAGILWASFASARRRSGACAEQAESWRLPRRSSLPSPRGLPPLAQLLHLEQSSSQGEARNKSFKREFASASNLHGNLQVLVSSHPFTFTFFAQTIWGKKKNPKGKNLIPGMMSELRPCQPEGKAFCQVMEKGPETADACVAFFFFY